MLRNGWVVQRLGLCTLTAKGRVQPLIEELKSHRLCGVAKKRLEFSTQYMLATRWIFFVYYERKYDSKLKDRCENSSGAGTDAELPPWTHAWEEHGTALPLNSRDGPQRPFSMRGASGKNESCKGKATRRAHHFKSCYSFVFSWWISPFVSCFFFLKKRSHQALNLPVSWFWT